MKRYIKSSREESLRERLDGEFRNIVKEVTDLILKNEGESFDSYITDLMNGERPALVEGEDNYWTDQKLMRCYIQLSKYDIEGMEDKIVSIVENHTDDNVESFYDFDVFNVVFDLWE